MKKISFLICFSLIATVSFGQKPIDGTYASHDPYNWSSIRFYSDSLFTYGCWACKGGVQSHGTYTMKGKNLILIFLSNDTIKNYSTEKITCPPNNNNYFNTYQSRFKKGDTEIFRIKEFNKDKLMLSQGKNDFNFWKKSN